MDSKIRYVIFCSIDQLMTDGRFKRLSSYLEATILQIAASTQLIRVSFRTVNCLFLTSVLPQQKRNAAGARRPVRSGHTNTQHQGMAESHFLRREASLQKLVPR